MRQVPRAFQRKREVVTGLSPPIGERLLLETAIEGGIDLNGRKVLTVEGEPSLLWETLRVEDPLPVLVAVARCADEQRMHDPLLCPSR